MAPAIYEEKKSGAAPVIRQYSDSVSRGRVGGEFAGARYGVTSTKLHSCLEDNPDK
jgi:hypothetical protein